MVSLVAGGGISPLPVLLVSLPHLWEVYAMMYVVIMIGREALMSCGSLTRPGTGRKISIC